MHLLPEGRCFVSNYMKSLNGKTLHKVGCSRTKTADAWYYDPTLKACSNCLGPTPSERFWPKVAMADPDECWEWLANIAPEGYGHFNITWRKPVGAHRFAYEEMVGPIPDGLFLDHLCRNRACFNPAHLDPVTHAENMRRARRTHCILRGHELTTENTYVDPRGYRRCRACTRARLQGAA